LFLNPQAGDGSHAVIIPEITGRLLPSQGCLSFACFY